MLKKENRVKARTMTKVEVGYHHKMANSVEIHVLLESYLYIIKILKISS